MSHKNNRARVWLSFKQITIFNEEDVFENTTSDRSNSNNKIKNETKLYNLSTC